MFSVYITQLQPQGEEGANVLLSLMKIMKWQKLFDFQGELFSRSYREREEAARQKVVSESRTDKQEPVTIRKIAITVPNATHKESEKQAKPEKKKEEEEEGMEEEEEEEEVEVEVSVAMRPHIPHVPETQIESTKKEQKEEAMEAQEEHKAQASGEHFTYHYNNLLGDLKHKILIRS